MISILERSEGRVYGLMRIVVGFLLACHGAQKLFGVLGRDAVDLDSLLGVAAVIELGAGVLVSIGLFTRESAFLSSGLMAVAYFRAHQPLGLLPIENGGELAAAYAFIFLFVAVRGSGAWAVDMMYRRTIAGP